MARSMSSSSITIEDAATPLHFPSTTPTHPHHPHPSSHRPPTLPSSIPSMSSSSSSFSPLTRSSGAAATAGGGGGRAGQRGTMDRRRDRYPHSIVWGPLPVISWLIPIIGHLGLCDSEGRVHDFAGPYTIGVDHFMVPVARILPIDLSTLPSSTPSSSTPDDPALLWDDGLHYADGHFSEQMHNICCNNCHHHVAMAMTKMGLGATFGTQVQCAWQVWTRGQWKSRGSMITTLLPFLIIVAVIALAVGLTR